MPFSKQTKIRSGYVIALMLLLTSYVLLFFIIQKLNTGIRSVSSSYHTIHKLESLQTELTEAETGVRGFLITKEISFLMPYYESVRAIPPLYEELKELTANDDIQRNNLERLNKYIKSKMVYLESGVREFTEEGLRLNEGVTPDRQYDKLLMDSIHSLIGDMEKEELLTINRRTSHLYGIFNSTNLITATSLLLVLITLVFALVTYNRENKGRDLADQNAKLYRDELETKVKELKKVNAELKELKHIEKFAATGRIARTIAHEVRNPLTNITLATEQLEEILRDSKDLNVYLEMISRNGNRINQLVSDLLQSTRFDNLEFKEIGVSELLDSTIELAKDRIGLKNIQVRKSSTPIDCTVIVDFEKMKLALLNIVVNALEAMENDKGILEISAQGKGNKCFIEIRDNGKGMDEDTLQKIFEPYYTGKAKGNGLGLTNSQNIIFNHKGNISVRSAPGEGTTFTVSLPRDLRKGTAVTA